MRILDLFCGAGGASVGYKRAFPKAHIIGVDIERQPNYPFEFVQGDAMTFPLDGFDLIHASPPCQRHSAMSACRPGLADGYEDFIAAVRWRLVMSGVPYVIENVEGSPLRNPTLLCGRMFGRELYRHRLFETSFPCYAPEHRPHVMPASRAGHWTPGTVMSVAGHIAPIAKARDIMGIDWMTRDELAEAIPPCYTTWIGVQFGYARWRGVAV